MRGFLCSDLKPNDYLCHDGFFHANNRTIAKEIKAGIFFHVIVQIGIIIL